MIPGWAQHRVLEGVVLDQGTQRPVPFATVGVAQQPLGTAANEAGAFRLVLPDTARPAAVVVSSVGYEAVTVPLVTWPVGRQTIRLQPATVSLGEVVVHGGKVKTKTFGRTGASTLMVAQMYTEPDLVRDELAKEQGTIIPVDPYCVLRDVNFFVAFNRFRSVTFRLQLYSVRQGLPDRPLLRRNVFVEVTQPRGWVHVDLQADSLVLRGFEEVAVTLQWVHSQAQEGSPKAFGIAAVPTPGHSMLFRDKSQAPWRTVKPGNLSVYLTADSYQLSKKAAAAQRLLATEAASDTLSQHAIDRVLGQGGARPPSSHHYGDSAAVGRYVPVAGCRLYCEQYGQGPPLLLLHGNGQSIQAFAQQIDTLARSFHVIAVDTRAHGKSQDATTGPLSYRLFAEDMRQLLDSLQLRHVAVLGWSDGGNTALEMARRYPAYVSRLVVMGANLFPTDQALDPALLTILRQQLPLLGAQAEDPAARTQARLYQLLLTEPQLTFADLAHIQTPVLVLAGEHDLVLDAHTRAIAAHLPHATCFIFPGATHNAPWELPTEFNQRVLTFLTSH